MAFPRRSSKRRARYPARPARRHEFPDREAGSTMAVAVGGIDLKCQGDAATQQALVDTLYDELVHRRLDTLTLPSHIPPRCRRRAPPQVVTWDQRAHTKRCRRIALFYPTWVVLQGDTHNHASQFRLALYRCPLGPSAISSSHLKLDL